jgi:hypothetical protein
MGRRRRLACLFLLASLFLMAASGCLHLGDRTERVDTGGGGCRH